LDRDFSPSPATGSPEVDRTAEAGRTRGYLAGETAAFAEVDRWVRSDLRRSYPRLGGELDDLCQTVHEKLLRELREGRFRGDSTLRTYVARITHYTAIDRLRELYRERALVTEFGAEQAEATENPYEGLEEPDEGRMLHRVLLALPAGCRELWRLVLVEKLSYAEIGQRLAIPPGTVKSRMWHCRRKAMAALERLRARAPRRGK